MSLLNSVNALGEWVLANFDKVLFLVAFAIFGYVPYKVIAREITKLKNKKRLEGHIAYTLTRVFR